jgi:pyruvate dehydrogenase E2 component (dihydrolipoamide acetyltransferase)
VISTVALSVKENSPMVEVMTDKATVEITAPATGVIAKLHAAEGETVPVHSVIVTIDEGGAGAAPAPAAATAIASDGGTTTSAPAAATAVAPPVKPKNGKVVAAPATRAFARQQGVDISTVSGTGPRGRVTKDDVKRAAAGGAPAVAPAPVPVPAPLPAPAPAVVSAPVAAPEMPSYAHLLPEPGQTERRVPLRGMRKLISKALVHSKHTAPHFTYVEEIDCTELVKARTVAKPAAAAQGVKLTYLPYIVKAICSGFRVFPMLNASLIDDGDGGGEIIYKGYYNIGIATDTPAGLMVPVVKDANRRSLLDIAREIDRVASAARGGNAAAEDQRDGTFTITSAGSIGGVLATPIINHPEVAILGVNKIEAKPVVRDGEIVIRHMTYMSISLDHRVVDGAHAALFMNHVKRLLENPSLLLLEL